MATIDEIIHATYYDKAGYGSQAYTLKHAKEKDPKIKLEDIKRYFENNIEKKGKMRGWNSFIAHAPFEEFQIDLFFFTEEALEYRIGLLIVDIFSKYISFFVPVNFISNVKLSSTY